jgi:tetratricopeptide (TPR) repeat protein
MRILSVFIVFVLLLVFASCNNSKTVDPNLTPVEKITKQIEENPDEAGLYIQRADLYEKTQKLAKAIEDVQKAIQLDSKNYGYYLKLADLFLATNQIQGCINTLNLVLANDPENVDANLKMAELNLMFKRYTHTIESANNALEADPYNAKAFFIKGFALKEYGDTAKAITNFMNAVKYNPDYYEAYVELGNLFREKKDPVAVTYYRNAINVKPQNTDAYYNLGMYYQQNDMLNEAQDAYKKIIEIDPSFPYSYFNIGYILLEISRTPDEAAPYFANAIKYKPDYYEAHFNLGLCFEEMGDVTKARHCYENALKYSNNYMKAIEGLNRLDNIMNRKN